MNQEEHARTQDDAAQEQSPLRAEQGPPLVEQGALLREQGALLAELEARLRDALHQAQEAQLMSETYERALVRAQAKLDGAQEAIAALEGEMRELVGENRGLRAALGVGSRQERGGAT